MLENVYEGLNVKNVYEGLNVKNVYESLNARSEVYLSKEYFCKMYPTCVSSKLCEFIVLSIHTIFSRYFNMIHHNIIKIFSKHSISVSVL